MRDRPARRCGWPASARRSSPRCRRWRCATGSVNLGQGFPDTDGPTEVVDAAVAAIRAGRNQYPPGPGQPELRQAIAEHQQRHYGLELDPDTEVLVTTGATEAIAAALLGLVDPGDEVVVLEPYYDSYVACIEMAGGVRRAGDAARAGLPARPRRAARRGHRPHPADPAQHPAQPDRHGAHRAPSWRRSPTLAVEHDLVVVTDEVYEHLTFDVASTSRWPRCPAWRSAR